ncbi:hypothetical protein BGX38DRAFT_1144152 [Terfezia claveryi]|nr:hypothetical protein BGX38DRAFT_1144152 [Terfezia claveryi]
MPFGISPTVNLILWFGRYSTHTTSRDAVPHDEMGPGLPEARRSLTIFDHIWSRLPPFPGFTRPNKAYRAVTQWQGKEMRNLLQVLLAVFTAALSRRTDAPAIATRHKASCHKAILCVRYLTDFILIAQYTVHTPGTIQSMRDYLQDFHKHKEVFLGFEHQSLRRPQPSGAHYNFPKMHLISHFADQIAKYGSLPQYSTEISRYLARYPYRQSSDTETDVARLMDAPLKAFITLQVAVPTFNDDGHMIHHVRCTGGKLFRKQEERHDWVFVRRHKSTQGKVSSGLDGRVPARLNALFKLRDIAAKDTYRLAHVSLMTIVGSSTPDGPEGMVRVGLHQPIM